MPTLLVTGSSRGLGLEWVRQYAREGWRVLATARVPAEAQALRQLAADHPDVRLYRLDVTDGQSVADLVAELQGEPIDVLVNNAGVYLDKDAPSLGCLRYDEWATTLAVNTLGALRVTEALVDNVARSATRLVVFTTSHMGSIADIGHPGSYYYRSSKAALNAAARDLALELRVRGVGVLILHPGAVRTRMGSPQSALSAAESVQHMRARIEEFSLADSGRFYNYDGTPLPW